MVDIIKSEFGDPTQDRDLKVKAIENTLTVASSSDEIVLQDNPGGQIIAVHIKQRYTSDVPEDEQNLKIYEEKGGSNQLDIRAVNTDDTGTEVSVRVELIYIE